MSQAIKHNGKDLTLTQDAYLDGGTVYLGGGAQYNGDMYKASAEDDDGNEYMVYWFDPAHDENGEADCDWDNPDHIASR